MVLGLRAWELGFRPKVRDLIKGLEFRVRKRAP